MKRSRVPSGRRPAPDPTLPRALAVAAVVAAALPSAGHAQTPTLTLAEALESALATHPTVTAAAARVDAAAGTGDAARAERLPGVAVEATLTRFELPMIVAPLHSLDLAEPPVFDRTLIQGQLQMAYTLFDGGGRSARVRGADALHDASRAGLTAAEMTVIEETVSAYVGVLSAQAVLDASDAQLQALQEEADRAQRRFDAGTAAELEVLRALASLQEARAEQASAQARVGLALRNLARQMAVEPAALSSTSLADVTVRPAVPGTPADSSELGRSPDIVQAERAAAAAEARVSEEQAGRFPTVQAGAGIVDYGTLDASHRFEWQAGVQVSWPLFTGGARNASVRRAQAELAAAQGDVEATRLRVAQASDAARTAVVEADARADALASAVAQWEEVARIEALALETGSGVQSDLLRAQAGLFQARAGHARARYDAVLSRVRLARANGTLDRIWMDEALEASR